MEKEDKYKDQSINTYCKCGDYFRDEHEVVGLLPCQHVMHLFCYEKYLKDWSIKNFQKKNNGKMKCKICNEEINDVIYEDMFNKKSIKSKYEQLMIDINTIKLNENETKLNMSNMLIAVIKLTSILNKLLNSKTKEDIISTTESLMSCTNIRLKIIDNTEKNRIKITNNHVEWLDEKINKSKIAIVANHSTYLDSVIIFYLFRCGFLTSDFINSADIGKIVANKLKLLVIKRGVDTNTVEKMKEYLNNDIDRIGVFPEGSLTNNDSIIRFRTGAFHLGVPICPVVIKFNKMIFDRDITNYFFKLMTQDKIEIEVYISDLIYPPFSPEKIEKVRKFMAKVGGMNLSRATNKFAKD